MLIAEFVFSRENISVSIRERGDEINVAGAKEESDNGAEMEKVLRSQIYC